MPLRCHHGSMHRKSHAASRSCRRQGDAAPGKRPRSQSPSNQPPKHPRLEATDSHWDRSDSPSHPRHSIPDLSPHAQGGKGRSRRHPRPRDVTLFDRDEVLRRAAEAKRAASQDRPLTMVGEPSLSSRWAKTPAPGPPGFMPQAGAFDQPPGQASRAVMDQSPYHDPYNDPYHDLRHDADGIDRMHSLPGDVARPHVGSNLGDGKKPRPIGAAGRDARPLPGTPHLPDANRRGKRSGTGSGGPRQVPSPPHAPPPYDLYPGRDHNSTFGGPEPMGPEAGREDGWNGSPGRDRGASDMLSRDARMRDEVELPPPPLPPPPPKAVRSSPQVSTICTFDEAVHALSTVWI